MTAHAGYHYMEQPAVTRPDGNQRPACQDEDPELFFVPEGLSGHKRDRHIEAAKAVCRRCPIIATCGETALAQRIPYGVFGGMSEQERAAKLAGNPDLPVVEPVRRCGNGHLLDEPNIYRDPSRDGLIRCRACGRENAARRRERRRAAARAGRRAVAA